MTSDAFQFLHAILVRPQGLTNHALKALLTLLNSIPSLGSAVFQTTTPPTRSSKKNSQPKPLEYATIELKAVRAKKRRMSVV